VGFLRGHRTYLTRDARAREHTPPTRRDWTLSNDPRRRRESPRIEAAFRVRYPSLDKLVVAYTHDLSQGGMFLATQRFLPINAVVRLQIELPEGGGEIVAIARVAYVRDAKAAQEDGKPAGLGVQFLDLEGESAERIERFITERTTLAAERTGSHRAVRARRLQVLVVDDDANYRALAAEPFVARGDIVRAAVDGLDALAVCLKDPPDVVLSDVQMPRMDGWQLLRMIRARPSLARVPVVFLSTLTGDDDRLKGYQFGVDDYVAKPFRADELVARVERVLERATRSSHPTVERKTLRGDLEQVSLPSLLSFFEVERKTGILLLVGDRVARLYLRDGRPLRVELIDATDGATPDGVVFDVLGWTSGHFEFAAQDVACEDQLRTTVSALIIEHARRVDEAGR
jgi:uncharacterized protein (TIGR02266 family)